MKRLTEFIDWVRAQPLGFMVATVILSNWAARLFVWAVKEVVRLG